MTDEDDGKECDAESRACYRAGRWRANFSQGQVCAEVHSEGACETNAATECQEHASAQALGAIPERNSKVLGRLW